MKNKETNVTIEQLLAVQRDMYLEARLDYELSLRKFSMLNVDKCPCCFESFYKEKQEELTNGYLTGEKKPSELEVLELMSITPVIREH